METMRIEQFCGCCSNCGCEVGDFNYCPRCGYPQKGDLVRTHIMQARDLVEEVIYSDALYDELLLPDQLRRLLERAWTKLHYAEEFACRHIEPLDGKDAG